MNIIDEAHRSIGTRLVIFLIFVGLTLFLTGLTVAHSKRLAEMLDVVSDSRIGFGDKWREMRRAWRSNS
jgi:hypothetical protein